MEEFYPMEHEIKAHIKSYRAVYYWGGGGLDGKFDSATRGWIEGEGGW
jgi:hypothetical protein